MKADNGDCRRRDRARDRTGIVGPNAGDLIAEVALAIEMDCEASDIGATIHPHPTLSETIAFAAEAFEGTIPTSTCPSARRSADLVVVIPGVA